MELLENPVRAYAWGSRTVIAELLGEPVPSPHPQAEIWLGAHPAAPSRLRRADGPGPALNEVVGADPDGVLGAGRSERWSGRLPDARMADGWTPRPAIMCGVASFDAAADDYDHGRPSYPAEVFEALGPSKG